jgi:hypothetical protein
MNDLTQEEKNYLLTALHHYKQSIYNTSNPNSGTRTVAETNDFTIKVKLNLLNLAIVHE